MSTLDCNQLYTDHFRSVYNYVYFRLRNTEETEDLVSEIFLKAVHSAHTYKKRIGASEKSWLFSIVRNTLIDHYRKKRIDVVDIENVELPHNNSSLEDDLDTYDQYGVVMSQLEQLPARQREILVLKYQADLSNKEIAKQLGLTASAVSSSLTKAIQSLQQLSHL